MSEVSPTLAVWLYALRLFGQREKALTWMATPLPELGGRTPEQVIAQDPDAVEAILDRIQYGVFS